MVTDGIGFEGMGFISYTVGSVFRVFRRVCDTVQTKLLSNRVSLRICPHTIPMVEGT